MVALLLCAGAFLLCYFAGRRSLVAGLGAVIGVGYFYGILRANVPTTFSHFIFDAGVLGFYATWLLKPFTPEDRVRIRRLLPWVTVLIAWPMVLLLIPIQDPLVQLVGLRAHIFLLPFLLIGARLRSEEVDRLVGVLAVLNLVAFSFAAAQFVFGIERFYPRNPVTELIYRSNDVISATALGAYRIPAIFANASSFGGTMVITLPLLLGAWVQKGGSFWRRQLLTLALAASVLGVFMAASRVHFLVLAAILLIASLSGRLGATGYAAWAVLLSGLGWAISRDGRLFERFLSLNWETLYLRLTWGMNEGFADLIFRYPLGNGLGGGGTSMPYFLQHLIRNPMWIENQYGSILLEQGVPGLLLWASFIFWVFTRRTTPRSDRWHFGRRLVWYAAAAYFAQGMIGVGLLSSVPFTAILLLSIGWITVRQPREAEKAVRPLPAPPVPAAAAPAPPSALSHA
jgi:hypothetical protein